MTRSRGGVRVYAIALAREGTAETVAAKRTLRMVAARK